MLEGLNMMRGIEYVHLINIEDIIPKSNFDMCQMILANILQKKPTKNQPQLMYTNELM